MTHPHVILGTIALVAVGVVAAQQATQDVTRQAMQQAVQQAMQQATQPPASSRHAHGPTHPVGPATVQPPVAPDIEPPEAPGASGPIADSIARLASDLAMLGMNHQGLSADEVERRRDSIREKLDELKGAMSEAIASEIKGASNHQGGGGHGHHGSAADLIDRVRRDPESIPLPATDSFVVGGLQVASGTHRAGTAATVNGDLDVYGVVDGNAVAVGGDVVLHPGSHVSGSAFAAGGQVRMDGAGGMVDGEIRSLQGPFGPAAPVANAATVTHRSRWHALQVAVSMFVLLILLGVAVLTFAPDQLDQVSSTLVEHFGRSAWYGLVGEIAVLPVFLLLMIGLAITIIGILALPFATIGYFVLVAGAATLGFVSVAEATGTAVLRTRGQAALTPRGAQLRAIIVGLSMYGGLWAVTALVGANSSVGITLRGIVVVITIVAGTVGFGAVVLWRFDLRRTRRQALAAAPAPADQSVWVTPTPVSGVAAARRPTPPASSTTGSST